MRRAGHEPCAGTIAARDAHREGGFERRPSASCGQVQKQKLRKILLTARKPALGFPIKKGGDNTMAKKRKKAAKKTTKKAAKKRKKKA